MILEVILGGVLIVLGSLIGVYLVRHLVFTFTVLYARKHPTRQIAEASFQPKVSVLIPAWNEERVIGNLLRRMCELTYPKDKLEVLVIDDASTDKTGKIAEAFTKTHSFVKVVHCDPSKGGRGKPRALNDALACISGEIICCIDADYLPQRDIIEKLNLPFGDPSIGASQGRVTVGNEPASLVTRLVALERIAGYRVDQMAREKLGLIPQFGGTIGSVRVSLLRSLGGWDETALTEDTDLTFRIYLSGQKVCYVNDAESYEEAPKTWRRYYHQRSRWAKGHMQCAFRHSLPLLRCKNLSFKEKLDGLLLLNIYFLPLIVALAWIIGITLYFTDPQFWLKPLYVAVILLSLYSTTGNFAPFFEIGIGAYLDNRKRIYWLIPLLFMTFFINMIICAKVFLELCCAKITGKRQFVWEKTVHSGYGNN